MSNQVIKLFAMLTIIFIVVNTVLGFVWIFQNFSFIPQYGDTNEYLLLSKTLKVDQYRGILYPVVLNYSNILSYFIHLKLQDVVYFIQIAFLLFATYSLSNLLLSNYSSSKKISLVVSIAVLCNPLVAHFTLTLLTDSLSTSFTIIFICYLIKGLKSATSKKLCIYLTFASLAFILMASLRVEKFYIAIMVALGSLFLMILYTRHYSLKKKLVSRFIVVLFLITSVGTVLMIKEKTSIVNANRPPMDIRSLIFNRVVWPRMGDVYQFLPVTLKAQITPEEAMQFDSHNNFVFPFLVKTLLKKDGKTQISTITYLTLQCFPLRIIGRILFDFGKYTVPNFAFPLEMVDILPKSAATSWTVSRMEMFTPKLTSVYLLVGVIQFCVFIAFLLGIKTSSINMLTKSFSLTPPVFLIVAMTILLNSTIFTLSFGMDAHIRYALPTYTILHIIVVTFTITRIFQILGWTERLFIDKKYNGINF